MFKGEGAAEVNRVARAIHEARGDGPLVAYLGQKEYYAIMRIEAGDPHQPSEKEFLGAELVQVCRDSYLHVVSR